MTPCLRVVAPGLLTTVQDLRPRRLPAPRRAGERRARSGQPARRQPAGRQCARTPARSKSPVWGRRLRSRPTTCGIAVAGAQRRDRDSARCDGDERHGASRRMRSVRLRRGEALRIGALTGAHGALCRGRGRLRHRAGARQRRRPTSAAASAAGRAARSPPATGCRCAWRSAGERGEVCLEGFDRQAAAARPRDHWAPRTITSRTARSRPSSTANTRSARAPTAWACGSPAARSGTAAASTSSPTASRRARSRCRATASRSCCSPTARPPAAIPKIATVISADLPALGAAAGRRQGRVRGGHDRGRRSGAARASSPSLRRCRTGSCRFAAAARDSRRSLHECNLDQRRRRRGGLTTDDPCTLATPRSACAADAACCVRTARRSAGRSAPAGLRASPSRPTTCRSASSA